MSVSTSMLPFGAPMIAMKPVSGRLNVWLMPTLSVSFAPAPVRMLMPRVSGLANATVALMYDAPAAPDICSITSKWCIR